NRHVVGAAPEAEDEDLHLLLSLVQAEREARGRRFVYDPDHFEARDLACVLRGLPLVVVEVGWDRNHGLLDGVAQERLGVLLDLLQYERADLLGVEDLALEAYRVVGPHLPLYLEDSPFRVGDHLPLGGFADEEGAVGRERDHGREHLPGRCRALGARYYHRASSFQDRGGRVGRAEVDSDYLFSGCAHSISLSLFTADSTFTMLGRRTLFLK